MGEIGDSEKASKTMVNEVLDAADASAIGGHLKDLPPGYYRSPKFVGSIIGVILMANSLYLGFVLPVRCYLPMLSLTLNNPLICWTAGKHALCH